MLILQHVFLNTVARQYIQDQVSVTSEQLTNINNDSDIKLDKTTWAVVIDWLEDFLPLAGLLSQESAHGRVHQINIQDYT